MKVIGLDENGNYIAIVRHEEIEKVANKYYQTDRLNKLKVGESFDLGAGFNFRSEIKSAVEGMVQGHDRFMRASETLTKFAALVGNQPQENEAINE